MSQFDKIIVKYLYESHEPNKGENQMDKLIIYFIGVFFVIGGIDYILGNPLKLGTKFEEGIKTMGPLAIGMIGIYSLSPIISKTLSIVIAPACRIINLDPSVMPSALMAVDMGGYQIASRLALTKEMGSFTGIIIASSLGATVSFTIPVAMGIISKEDEKYFSKGIMIGITSIPLGCLAAGLWQKINISILVWNLMPVFIFTIILGIGLLKIPDILMKVFNVFGRFIIGLSVIGLLFQGIYMIFGIQIMPGLLPLSESVLIVAKISFILGGAYPMLEIIKRIFKGSLEKAGKKFDIDSSTAAGILGCLASNLVAFGMYKEMSPKGKVVCTAFGVGGAFVFGGQFGFVSGIAPEMLGAFIISKFTAGIISIILALKLNELAEERTNVCYNATH